MQELKEKARELQKDQYVLDKAIDIQVVLQLLIKKGIVTREEVQEMRSVVANSPKYKSEQENITVAAKRLANYAQNPNQYLRDLLKAKMDGYQ